MALEQMGYLIVIDGPSKIGKIVLCEAVIGRDKLVAMTGNDFKGENDFWSVVARKVVIPLTGEVQNESAVQIQGEQIGTRYTSRYQTNKERVMKYFLEFKLDWLWKVLRIYQILMKVDVPFESSEETIRKYQKGVCRTGE